MTIEQEILEELRRGTSLADLRRRFRSQSQLYGALREYLKETDKIVDEHTENLRNVKEQLSKVKAEFQKTSQQNDIASSDLARTRQENAVQSAEAKDATKKLAQARVEVKELEAKGYSPTIVAKLKAVEANSGQELLMQVQTAEKYVAMKGEFSGLEKRKAGLEGEVRALETESRTIKQSVVSEKNILDEMKLQTVTYKKAMVALESLLKIGYSTEDIKSLEHGLAVLGIKGDPTTSITRLVNGLTRQKTLRAVEEKLRRRREELAETNKDLATARNELASTMYGTLKAIRECQTASTQAVASTRDSSTQAIAATEKRAEDGIKKTIEEFEGHFNESVGKFDAQMRQTIEKQKTDLAEVIELERRRAEAETVLGPATVLVGMLKSQEDLKAVPLPFIMQLLEKIQLWLETNHPTDSIEPPRSIISKEHHLSAVWSYRLAVLVELAKEGLKQLMTGQRAR